jgi:hypothetical protein
LNSDRPQVAIGKLRCRQEDEEKEDKEEEDEEKEMR